MVIAKRRESILKSHSLPGCKIRGYSNFLGLAGSYELGHLSNGLCKTEFLKWSSTRKKFMLAIPDGFVVPIHTNTFYKLKKALYGNMALNLVVPLDTHMVEKSKLDEVKEGKAVDPITLSCICRLRIMLGCHDTRRRTSVQYKLLGDRLVSWLLSSCPLDEITILPNLALDSIKIQCTVITKVLLPYACNNVQNFQIQAYRQSGFTSSRIEFLYQQAGNAEFYPGYSETIGR
ncbi:hypothetical protein Tco_0294554 [Tanacetum coccineum]